jgi:hypothetical protein
MSLHRVLLLDQRLPIRVFCMGTLVTPLARSERNGFFFIDYPSRRFMRLSKFRTSQTRTWPTVLTRKVCMSDITINETLPTNIADDTQILSASECGERTGRKLLQN